MERFFCEKQRHLLYTHFPSLLNTYGLQLITFSYLHSGPSRPSCGLLLSVAGE